MSDEMKHRCPKCKRFGMEYRLQEGVYGYLCMWRDCLHFNQLIKELKNE